MVVAGLGAGCGGSSDTQSTPLPTPTVSAGGAFEYAGITHVSWWHDEYGYGEASTSRSHLATTGVGWAGVLVTWYMDRRDSSSIAPHAQRTPSDDVLRVAIDEMHELGLKVMLKPHVDVLDGAWRGTIRPADAGAWFASYAAYVNHVAALAQERGVEMLSVGTELVTMSGAPHAAAWAGVIAGVRARYGGPLTYAANANEPGDEFTSVSFWPHVDFLGLDVYTPLTGKTNPTLAELVTGWRRNRYGHDMVAAYRNWQAAWGKPVLFTEIGYRSADGTNLAPWDFQAAANPDPGEQADCFRAAYDVWSPESAWMKGLFWWSWSVPVPGPGDTDYNPRGKPAESVIRLFQGR